MKRSLLPIVAALLVLPASASEEAPNSYRPVASTLTTSEKTRIFSAASRMLDNAIAFRGDGTARSIYRANGRRILLEWRGLVVRQVIHGSVAIEERDAGVTRRFYAQLHAQSFRSSTSGGESWSAWQSQRCQLFPSHILIEEVNGRFKISAPGLAHFTPTPDPKIIDPNRELMPHERVLVRR